MVEYVCATVHNRAIPNSEKMSHLKTLLTGKACAGIAKMGYSGELYGGLCWNVDLANFN